MRRWEVYREVPASYMWMKPGPSPYWRCFTRKGAEKMAARCDWAIRNGRSDAEFAAFKVRRVMR